MMLVFDVLFNSSRTLDYFDCAIAAVLTTVCTQTPTAQYTHIAHCTLMYSREILFSYMVSIILHRQAVENILYVECVHINSSFMRVASAMETERERSCALIFGIACIPVVYTLRFQSTPTVCFMHIFLPEKYVKHLGATAKSLNGCFI